MYSTNRFQPDEYIRNQKAQFRLSAINYIGAGMLWLLLLAGSAAPQKQGRELIWFAGLLSGITATVARKELNDLKNLDNDYQDIAVQATQDRIYQQMRPVQEAYLESPIAELRQAIVPFDFQRFATERNDFPHISIEGKTGGGKTWLAEHLTTLFGGRTIAIAPHWEHGDFSETELIIGQGRNYGVTAEGGYMIEVPGKKDPKFTGVPFDKKTNTETEELIDLLDILSGELNPDQVTVCQFMNALVREMDRRYQLDPETGKRVGGEELNIIIDEYNSFAKRPGIGNALKLLLREARKVGIRIILLVQGSEVAALGIEGEGSLRECLTRIRVKQFAIDHCRLLVNKYPNKSPEKDLYQQMLRRLENDDRPCMVEDQYSVIPSITKQEPTPYIPHRVEPVETLTLEQQKVLDYLRKKNKPVDATTIRSNLRIFKEGSSTDKVRTICQELVELGKIGAVGNDKYAAKV